MSLRPAWSGAFAAGVLQPVTVPPGGFTQEWAFADATGGGVDSGVDARHPAVAGGAALSWDRETERVALAEGPHEDLFGHGTACAGIIRRAAPDCRVHSVRGARGGSAGRGQVFAEGPTPSMTKALISSR